MDQKSKRVSTKIDKNKGRLHQIVQVRKKRNY